MKKIDVQARLESARAGVAVLRGLQILDQTMRYSQFATAIGLDIAAQNEFDTLKHRCGPSCSSGQLSTLRLEEGLSGASYGLGAASLAATITLVAIALRYR